MTLAQLNDQIAAVCPIDGINSDGVIWFKPEATDDQRKSAQALMNQQNLKPADVPPIPETQDTPLEAFYSLVAPIEALETTEK